MLLSLVQHMPDYMISVDQNGVLYYDFNNFNDTYLANKPYIIYSSGEAVSPDELLGYIFTELNVDEIKPINEYPLYNQLNLS